MNVSKLKFCQCGGKFQQIESRHLKCERCGNTIHENLYFNSHKGIKKYTKVETKYWEDPDL